MNEDIEKQAQNETHNGSPGPEIDLPDPSTLTQNLSAASSEESDLKPLEPATPSPNLENEESTETPPTMAASARLKPFSTKKNNTDETVDNGKKEGPAPFSGIPVNPETPGSSLTQTLTAPGNINSGPSQGLTSTIHSETATVAGLDLAAPGGAPPKPHTNILINCISGIGKGTVNLFKRIPPLEDIFDMIMTYMGFQRKPPSMLRRAQSLAAKGRHADAIKWYRDILYLRPLTIAAYDGLGRVYFRMGLVEEANREFVIADCLERLVNNRDDLDAACSLAKAFIERKQVKMAASLLEPVLVAHFYSPHNNELLKKMGLVYAELRATRKLYQVYEAGLAQYPDDHEFYILKGNLDIKLGQVAEGEKLIRWGRLMGRLKENPQDINANMAMGELCLKEDKQPEGLAYLKQAATLSPENSGIRWRLFNLYQKQGQFQEALRYFLEVINIEPDNEELRYKLADFYRKNRVFDDALNIYKNLIDKHPRDPRPHYLISSLYSDMNQFDEAQNFKTLADTLAIGLKENPDHLETVTFMRYLFSINENKEAFQWLERGLAKWPYHGELILTKVKLLYNEYHFKEAVALLKRLITIKHDVAEPHMWIALCYQRLGDNMAALAEAQLTTRLAPKSFTAHKVLGDILKEQKKVSQANAAYEVAEMIKLTQAKAGNAAQAR